MRHHEDESRLIVRAQRGDDDAFDALVARHGRVVLAVVRRIVRRAEDAEDVAQDVFIRLYRALPRIDPAQGVEAWLVRASLNAARSFASRNPSSREDELPGLTAEPYVSDPSLPVEQAQLRKALAAAINSLPAREREVFILREVEQLSSPVIGDVLDISAVTVRRQTAEARRKIVAWFEKHRPELVPLLLPDGPPGPDRT